MDILDVDLEYNNEYDNLDEDEDKDEEDKENKEDEENEENEFEEPPLVMEELDEFEEFSDEDEFEEFEEIEKKYDKKYQKKKKGKSKKETEKLEYKIDQDNKRDKNSRLETKSKSDTDSEPGLIMEKDSKRSTNIKAKGKRSKKEEVDQVDQVDQIDQIEQVDQKETSKMKSKTKVKTKEKTKTKIKTKAKDETKDTKEKSKKVKRPTKATKIPITGTARKLPIDEDEGADIDWTEDEQSESDTALLEFERYKMNEKMKYMEREKLNYQNELYHLRPDLENKNKIINELKDDYSRLRKDFDKYKQRVREDEAEKQEFANEKLINNLLDVLDNFDRTNQQDSNFADKEDILMGIKLIHNQLMDILQKQGLKIIEAKGEPFDPYIHEAISTEDTDEHPNNTILEELQKGYSYKEKVLRPSKVKVSQSEINPALPTRRELEKKEREEQEKLKKEKKEKKQKKEKKEKKEKKQKKEKKEKKQKKQKKEKSEKK